MHVVLFDIDGTLTSKESTEHEELERFVRPVSETAGKVLSKEPWLYDGMVDPEIYRLLLIESGMSPHSAMRSLPRVISRAEEVFLRMETQPVLNEGVSELLRILSTCPNHRLGVLTGNLSAVAEEKLRLTGIRSYFAETFYSNCYFDRVDLVRDAVRTCTKKYALRSNGDVVIVGDTPRDIEAANANQARAVGVASGHYSVSELVQVGAAAAFRSLDPCHELLQAVDVEIVDSLRD